MCMLMFRVLTLLQDLQVFLSDFDTHNVVLEMKLMDSALFQYSNSLICMVPLRGNELYIILWSVENGMKSSLDLSLLWSSPGMVD
jgi:hypothetical protein